MNGGIRLATTLAALSCSAPCTADAQSYPSRPMALMVPVAAGGGADTIARIVAERMSRSLGQTIVVENRPGGGGAVATRQLARSEPDGYNLGIGMSATLSTLPAFMPNAGYDPRKDFSPIGLIGVSPLIVTTHPSVPARSIEGLIALARREPGKLSYASGGTGSPTHLAPELFASMTNVRINHIPYKGTGPAIADLLGGHVSMAFTSLPPAIGLAHDGKIRALAVTSVRRTAALPEVPTIAESGLPGYEAAPRYGIIGPARMPAGIVGRLNVALREALASDEVRARLASDGAEVLASTPDEYGLDIDREEKKWSSIIRQLGIGAPSP